MIAERPELIDDVNEVPGVVTVTPVVVPPPVGLEGFVVVVVDVEGDDGAVVTGTELQVAPTAAASSASVIGWMQLAT